MVNWVNYPVEWNKRDQLYYIIIIRIMNLFVLCYICCVCVCVCVCWETEKLATILTKTTNSELIKITISISVCIISINFHCPNGHVRCHCSISLFQLLKCPIHCCSNCLAIGQTSMVTMLYLQLAALVVCSVWWLEDLTILIRDKRAPYPNKLNASLHCDPAEWLWCQSFVNASPGAVHSMTIW